MKTTISPPTAAKCASSSAVASRLRNRFTVRSLQTSPGSSVGEIRTHWFRPRNFWVSVAFATALVALGACADGEPSRSPIESWADRGSHGDPAPAVQPKAATAEPKAATAEPKAATAEPKPADAKATKPGATAPATKRPASTPSRAPRATGNGRAYGVECRNSSDCSSDNCEDGRCPATGGDCHCGAKYGSIGNGMRCRFNDECASHHCSSEYQSGVCEE
jgi:hypothetical protein